jgi:hypothetical protein
VYRPARALACRAVLAVFVLYVAIIVAGLSVYIAVGVTHH